jgi:hypothetical protein
MYNDMFDDDFLFDESPTKSNKGGKKVAIKCAHTHPVLKIEGFEIYGGSCIDPIVNDADIYVGFERGMSTPTPAYPWTKLVGFYFPIPDGGVPFSIQDFKNLLTYLENNLREGKKVHIGCIGGHGRTGLVLAALVTKMTGNTNSISYVRTNYCSKAVESNTQVEWLHKHFGIQKVAPSKSHANNSSFFSGGGKGVAKSFRAASNIPNGEEIPEGFTLSQIVTPFRVKGNCWGF